MDGRAMGPDEVRAEEIVAFWQGAGAAKWFSHDDAFDREIRERFGPVYEAAKAGRLDAWRESPDGVLALLILLDQFPRNMFRKDPRTWATDALALDLAEEGVARGFDTRVAPDLRRFFYLPYMHAEDPVAQERSVALNEALGDADALAFARHHRDIVARFGRFPHRNEVLGRPTTPEEARFLEEDSFRG